MRLSVLAALAVLSACHQGESVAPPPLALPDGTYELAVGAIGADYVVVWGTLTFDARARVLDAAFGDAAEGGPIVARSPIAADADSLRFAVRGLRFTLERDPAGAVLGGRFMRADGSGGRVVAVRLERVRRSA
ncbi:MAG TPA: hypothetical protein VFN76_10155 [Candidatus Limnocylindria bacterium]|nr:hypothetical protein [Candidatus Limnocylindria bacterium]